MKKLILMLLAALWGVNSVNADGDFYLRSNLNANKDNSWYSWNFNADNADTSINGSEYKFTDEGVNPKNSNENVYSYTVDASDISGDIYFRLWIYNWTEQLKPSQGQFTLDLSSSISTGYEINSYHAEYKHTGEASNYFIISHSTIKARAYKIVLYKDNSTFTDGGTGKVYMSVSIVDMPATIGVLGYSTFSCNRALDFTDVTALSAYKASVNDGKVVLTKVDGKVAANTGLLLAGTSANIPVVPTAEGEDISETNLLKASVTETEVAASGTDGKYHYFLAGTTDSDIGFYNIATTTTSGAGKAYLETTTALASEPASARVAWVFQDDETTGITDATRSLTTNDVFFDLTGRRVMALRGGLYIKNGKKVIVK